MRSGRDAEIRRHSAAPETPNGIVTWSFAKRPWQIRFFGRGAPRTGELAAAGILAADTAEAWLRQIHSNRWVVARAGVCGEADALRVDDRGIAATIATADCVPIVVARGRRAVVIHAGWRGLVNGVVGEAVASLGASDGDLAGQAWIGPAIGPCCYEVGEEVADAVVATSGPSIRRSSPSGGRPHIDLRAVAVRQLVSHGVGTIDWIDACTRCCEAWLWSYRRDGAGAGRNLTVIWRDLDPTDDARC